MDLSRQDIVPKEGKDVRLSVNALQIVERLLEFLHRRTVTLRHDCIEASPMTKRRYAKSNRLLRFKALEDVTQVIHLEDDSRQVIRVGFRLLVDVANDCLGDVDCKAEREDEEVRSGGRGGRGD